MASGFHHITLNVSDLARSRRFYQALPGFVMDQDMPGYKARFRVGTAGTRLVLVPPLPGTPDGDRFSEHRIGLDHLAIGVSGRAELDAMLAVLRELGAETDGIHLDRAGDAAMITFRDPDNIQWEFFEEEQPMTAPDHMRGLDALVGHWTIQPRFQDLPAGDGEATAEFEWMPGGRFLIQRWTVPVPEAPDGLAVIGPDPEAEGQYLQHYFDTRGVARVYRMTLRDRTWRLWRDEPDFSPLDFRQRFTGTFSDDGRTITGAWEICHDGSTWEHDFDLVYTKTS